MLCNKKESKKNHLLKILANEIAKHTNWSGPRLYTIKNVIC